MTNTEIITRSAVMAGLYTKEEAEAILKTGACLPLHTYSAWKAAGYQVKRGRKNRFDRLPVEVPPGQKDRRSGRSSRPAER